MPNKPSQAARTKLVLQWQQKVYGNQKYHIFKYQRVVLNDILYPKGSSYKNKCI